MNADWVGASVRARSMARRRVGAGAAREIAAQPSLGSALALLADSVHAGRLAGCTTLADAQRATRETVLWQLRVLAGWLSAGGTRLLRAVAGGFERDNILALARRLDGHPTPADFELGALATAWPRLRTASSVEDLVAAVRRSAWGDPGAEGSTTLPDVLTLVWLRTVAGAAPEARRWTAAASALTVGRSLLVERVVPSVRLREVARPLLGRTWEETRDLAAFRAALPSSVRPALDGVEDASRLWRAEAALRARVESDAHGLLHGPRPGPSIVLGAIAVLDVDAWRVRAALAAAAVGAGSSEVLDAAA
ncbi:hypothetical protein [Cellulomonas sp. KRMCY2]|uniref:hypothetical protein n=1 Tax=Cellulomonas sp. KRMCY2 TaxID=1304865 RepID=UPI00045E7F3C|nr:hypothetical protein [Cellulomonas sp. KRMCY2]